MSLLILPIAWIVTAAGRSFMYRLRLWIGAAPLERNLFGFGLGLGMLAYGMLLIGLFGGFYPIAGLIWTVLLACFGGGQHLLMGREIKEFFQTVQAPPVRIWTLVLLFLALAAVPLVGVYTPPVRFLFIPAWSGIADTEWDSLAYHLADPKLYLQAHRISYLPWESHSNFAFTAEMWYTLALMAKGSVPLAKMFHFACGVGTTLAICLIGRRHLCSRVGLWAAALFASTPIVLWEAGTAYVDLASAFFATLALLAVANGVKERQERWLWLGAILVGLTLSTKATALTTLAIFALGILYWRLRIAGQPARAAVLQTALWCGVALLAGCPWYVKAWIYTGNPVYPFFYHLFGGRYWNEAAAAAYTASNASFGMGHGASDALLAPWNMTLYPMPGHIDPAHPELMKKPFNDFPSALVSLSPVLLASLFFPAFLRTKTPGLIKALGLYALFALLFWFLTMQYLRYLLLVIPVFCLLAAWVLVQVRQARMISGYALTALAACSVGFGLLIGGRLALAQAPVVFGEVSRDRFIAANDASYPAMQFINTQLPSNAKVVFYGQPMGFYCDKPYLWGEATHSAYIPYDRLRSPEDLKNALRKIGVTHILINRQFFPVQPGSDYVGQLYTLTAGSQTPLYDQHGIAIYALK